jgi:hypothetical protein
VTSSQGKWGTNNLSHWLRSRRTCDSCKSKRHQSSNSLGTVQLSAHSHSEALCDAFSSTVVLSSTSEGIWKHLRLQPPLNPRAGEGGDGDRLASVRGDAGEGSCVVALAFNKTRQTTHTDRPRGKTWSPVSRLAEERRTYTQDASALLGIRYQAKGGGGQKEVHDSMLLTLLAA